MVVDRSDFSVATYSVASSIGVTAAVARATGVGGIWGGGPPLCVRLQAVTASVIHTVVHTSAVPAVLLSDMVIGLSRTGKVPGRPERRAGRTASPNNSRL